MKIQVGCPRCGRRIFDAESSTKSEIRDLDDKKNAVLSRGWKPDYYVKCWKCKARIGIRKVG